MNEEICCIINEGKMARNEWENDDSDFFQALYSVYKKLGQFFSILYSIYIILLQLIIFLKVNKYESIGIRFFKNTMYTHNPFNKVIKF